MSRHETTTENVRWAWAAWSLSTEDENGFDRWLQEVTRAAKEQAWDECAEWTDIAPYLKENNPHRVKNGGSA